MILTKKIRQNPNNTGVCIGVVMSDQKNRVAYSMARNAVEMSTVEGRCKLCSKGQLSLSDEFEEDRGYGRAVKRLLSGGVDIAEFAKKNAHKIRPDVVENLQKYIFATETQRKEGQMTVPDDITAAERILAEMLDMQERSIRYFK